MKCMPWDVHLSNWDKDRAQRVVSSRGCFIHSVLSVGAVGFFLSASTTSFEILNLGC